ncbi:hypothetical protein GCM10027521_12550 [Amycolatopsis cihanbeyliensis]
MRPAGEGFPDRTQQGLAGPVTEPTGDVDRTGKAPGGFGRRDRAEAENWAGEIEGIDTTLTFPRAKREDTRRTLRRPAISLGIPTFRGASGQ